LTVSEVVPGMSNVDELQVVVKMLNFDDIQWLSKFNVDVQKFKVDQNLEVGNEHW